MDSKSANFATALSVELPSFKPMLGLIGVLMLCLLITLRAVPSIRLSTLFLAIASASFMLVKHNKTTDLLHPVRVFGALWCLCLALASMRLLPIISDWSDLMWSCVLTALASFISGFGFAKWYSDRGAAMLGRTSVKEVLAESLLPNRKTLVLAGLCLVIGMVVLAYEFFLIGGIPILADNVDAMRMELFGVTGSGNPTFNTLSVKLVHPLVDFVKYGVFLAFIVLFQKKTKGRGVILLSLFIILLGTLAYSSQAGRQFFVNIVVTGVALFHYLRRRFRLVELGAALVALFLIIGLLGAIRTERSQSGPFLKQILSRSSFPEGVFWNGVAFGYGSCTLSFEIFYRLTEDLRSMPKPSGGYLFYALHRFIPRANLQEVTSDLYSDDLITTTFLGDFYADYGYWGVLLGPLALGLLYGWVYAQGGGSNALYWIYVRALFVLMLLFFPYGNLFSGYLTWIFDLFFMYFLIGHLKGAKEQQLSPRSSTNEADSLPPPSH